MQTPEMQTEAQTESAVADSVQRRVRRLGRFNISGYLLNQNWMNILPIMGNFVIIRAEFVYHQDKVAYVAYSPLFDECPEGCEPPDYDIIATKDGDKITVTAQKSPNDADLSHGSETTNKPK